MENEKIFAMPFYKVYLLLIHKAERKGRTKEEVIEVTSWLTGYSTSAIENCMNNGCTYGDFFRNAPMYNEKAELITGTICGIRIENIDDPLMKKIRQLDKLVDELAKGKQMNKILRE